MLRSAVLIFGAVCLVGGLIAMRAGLFPPAIIAVVWGALLIIGTVYERVRYKALEPAPQVGRGRRVALDAPADPLLEQLGQRLIQGVGHLHGRGEGGRVAHLGVMMRCQCQIDRAARPDRFEARAS